MSNKDSLIPLKSLIFHFHATNTIIVSFLPLYLKYKELTSTEIGWVLAIGPFASVISQPLWGYLSDKYKTTKRMIIISVVCMLMISVIFFQMDSLLTFLIFGAFLFFFSSPVGALSDSLGQRRAVDLKITFGSIRMWGSIGFAFSSLIVGGILSKIGVQFIAIPYVILGSILLISSFLITDIKTESTPIQLSDINKILKNKPFLFFLFLIMFITITLRANDSFVGIYITELGGNEGMVGLAFFIGVTSEAIIFAFSKYWYRKFHPIAFIILAGILLSLRWFLYGMTTSPYLIITFQFLHGLTFGIFYIAAFDYVTRIIPDLLQSTGHLIFFAVMVGVSGIIGSMAGGSIMEVFGGQVLYTLMGLFTLVGVFLLIGYRVWMKHSEG